MSEPCECILKDHPGYMGHTSEDHSRELCSGSWTFDPPCGGCINCAVAQAHYYDEQEGSR